MTTPNSQGNVSYGWNASYTTSAPTTTAYSMNANSYAAAYTTAATNHPDDSSDEESDSEEYAENQYSHQGNPAMYQTSTTQPGSYSYPYAQSGTYGYNAWQTPSANVAPGAPTLNSGNVASAPAYTVAYRTPASHTPSHATSVPHHYQSQQVPPSYQATPSGSSSDAKSLRRPHNRVERRYRQNINDQLEQLRQAIPALAHEHRNKTENSTKPSKGQILSGALEYIRSLEEECSNLTEQLNSIRRC